MSLEARSSSEKVHEDWKSTAKGWRKWDEQIMNWLQPVGDAMVGLAELEDGFVVLDVATGSGEPGLSAARRLVNGRVIGLDISEDMLSTAAEKARRLGIKNYETRLYKGDKFPFGPDSFDAVTCRFGVMFFPDMLGGLKEMVRVVKPGRKVCVAVWGPQNQFVKAVFQFLRNELGLPEEPADSPNPFRCSQTGKIESLFLEAGLRGVVLTEIKTQRSYASLGQYWEFVLDMNADIRTALDKAGEKALERSKLGVQRTLGPAEKRDGSVHFDFPAWVTCGTT